MRRPSPPAAPINAQRFQRWLANFSGYRDPVTQAMIEMWLTQFPEDRDLAARLLDSVQFLGNQHMRTTLRELLKGLDGWDANAAKRRGRWFFAPFTASAGESGDTMLHALRMATGMNRKEFNPIFVYRSDLVRMKPTANDTVVLVDDFSGSGKQACDAWDEVFAELLSEGPRVILLLIAATREALNKIRSQTAMDAVCGTTLTPRDNLFDGACNHFTAAEKAKVLTYCEKADGARPKGFGECGLLLVLAHRCPNNSIPILHASHAQWEGLFPRQE